MIDRFKSHYYPLASVKQRIARWDEALLLVVILAIVVLVYRELLSLRPTTRAAPLIAAHITAISLIIIVFIKLKEHYGFTIQKNKKPTENQTGSQESESTYEINLQRTIPEIIWVTGYILGILYIGLFTVSAIYAFSYIFFNESDDAYHVRFLNSLKWSIGLVIFIYVLLVEIIGATAIWRLGFLP